MVSSGLSNTELSPDYWSEGSRKGMIDNSIELKLAPNPVSEALTLTTSRNGIATYTCYDPVGRPIVQSDFERYVRIETADWVPGVYTIEVHYADRDPVSERVIVSR